MTIFMTSQIVVPIPEMIRPTMIIENILAPACNATPNSKMIVPNAKESVAPSQEPYEPPRNEEISDHVPKID
jgi:hypothetical protein